MKKLIQLLPLFILITTYAQDKAVPFFKNGEAQVVELFKDEKCNFFLLNTYTPMIYNVEFMEVNTAKFGLIDAMRETSKNNLNKVQQKIENKFNNPNHSFSKISSFNTNDWSINIGSSLKKGHSINAFFNTLNSDGYDLNDIEFLNTVEPYKNYTGFIRYNYENENLSVFSSYRIYHEDQEFKINKNIYGDNAINESSFITSINYKANDKLSLVIDNYHTKYKNEEALESYSLDYDESFFNQSLYKAELRSIYEINQKNKLIKRIKIPSGEITNYQYLHQAGQCRLPIIMSTGMSNDKEISRAISVLCNAGMPLNLLTVLHCNTEYPTPMDDVNLKAMLRMKESHRVEVGYSDHTIGTQIPIYGVAAGASIIEKHFTLDSASEGPDHSMSADPKTLSELVKRVRWIEEVLGKKNMGIMKAGLKKYLQNWESPKSSWPKSSERLSQG